MPDPARIHRNIETGLWPENFWIFSGAFRPLSARNRSEVTGKEFRKISGQNPAFMFRCIPAGTVPYSLTWVINTVDETPIYTFIADPQKKKDQ